MKTANHGPVGNMLKLAGAMRKDGWKNLLTGLGVKNRDKRLGAEIEFSPLTETDSENLYSADDIAAKVVDYIPDEGTREWIEYKLNEKNSAKIIKDIENFNTKMKTKIRFQKAWKWSRLYGGAGIFIAVDDGAKDLLEPLDLNKIRSIKALTVLNRYELQPRRINRDITSSNFNFPDSYSVSPRTASTFLEVHHSRIIRFDGVELPRSKHEINNLWGDSVLTRLFNVLRNFNLAHDSAASVMQDFKVGILKLQGLADLVVNDDEKFLKERIEIMNLSKSVLNTIVLDAENEGFENLTTSLAGVAEMLGKIDDRLVAATSMPHTIILGTGATGVLSGAGESEKQQLADFVKNHQETSLRDKLERYNLIIMSAKQGPTSGKVFEDLGFEFKSLWQMNEKDKAELRNKTAQTDAVYHGIGVLDADEIRNSRFGGDQFSIETDIDETLDMNNEEGEEDIF